MQQSTEKKFMGRDNAAEQEAKRMVAVCNAIDAAIDSARLTFPVIKPITDINMLQGHVLFSSNDDEPSPPRVVENGS